MYDTSRNTFQFFKYEITNNNNSKNNTNINKIVIIKYKTEYLFNFTIIYIILYYVLTN